MATQTPQPDAAFTPTRHRARRAIGVGIVVLAVAAWLASGVYVVQQDERGVVRQFGRVVEADVEPGMHYAWPWPIGRVDHPRVSEVRRVGVGFRLSDGRIIEPQSEVLTGDENILVVTMIVQYRLSAPARYLFATEDADALVPQAVRAVLLATIGRMRVDDVLTIAKGPLQSKVQLAAQALLDRYDTGVHLLSTDLQIVDPPADVIESFKDVASAKKDREKFIDQAAGYRNTVLPKARGLARSAIEQAEGYRVSRVNRAMGDAERFRLRFEEYRRAPAITRTRLLLEALERILPRIRAYVLDTSDGGSLRVRIIEQP